MTAIEAPAAQDGGLVAKARRVAALQGALVSDVHRLEAESALQRTRLAGALVQALAVRDEARRGAAEARIDLHRAASRRRPRRHNRPSRALDRLLLRLGAPGRALIVARSGLWGEEGGLRAWPRRLAGIFAYVRRGTQPGARAPVLFDHDAYLDLYPDIAAGRLSPLAHYLTRGAGEGRAPNPLFDPRFYAARNGPALGATGLSPLEHYVRLGAAQGADPHPLFSGDWYVGQRGDLAAAGINPLAHYLADGWREDVDPHPLFDTAFYRAQMGAAAEAVPPLVHYLTEGWRLGLRPHPLVDPVWMLEQYPDLAEAGEEPLTHFVLAGAAEGRDPSGWFSTQRHRDARGEALAPDANPLIDYLTGGAWLVDEAGPGLATWAYVAAHPELAAERVTPLEHWALRADG